jgi:hypothetical protein
VNWCWVITVQWNAPLGLTSQTIEGDVTAEQAARLKTRPAVRKAVLAETRRSLGIPGGVPVSILFYSLEPEALEGVAQ